MTNSIHNLVEDARNSGYEIRVRKSSILIGKKIKDRISLGIEIFLNDNGGFYKANRADVDQSIASNIRTIKEVRKILNLKLNPSRKLNLY